jgi:hypothetical protein
MFLYGFVLIFLYWCVYFACFALQNFVLCISDTPLVILDHSLVFKVTYTRRCIDTTGSPDDEHEVARNM